jgi:hypothetical protein
MKDQNAGETSMRRVTVNMSVTLDGVIQAPGRADEDLRGGFEHGGWGLRCFDPVMGKALMAGITTMPALLFGGLLRGLAEPDRQSLHRHAQPGA